MTPAFWKIEEWEQAFKEITSRGIPFDIPPWGPHLNRVVIATRILGAWLVVVARVCVCVCVWIFNHFFQYNVRMRWLNCVFFFFKVHHSHKYNRFIVQPRWKIEQEVIEFQCNVLYYGSAAYFISIKKKSYCCMLRIKKRLLSFIISLCASTCKFLPLQLVKIVLVLVLSTSVFNNMSYFINCSDVLYVKSSPAK